MVHTTKSKSAILAKRWREKNKERVKKYCKEVQRPKMKIRRKELKKQIISIMGGKCTKCGYNKNSAAFEFHHKGDKENEIHRLFHNYQKNKLLEEIKKCVLLCSNCHREVHNPHLNL